jgi:hypothetical protein
MVGLSAGMDRRWKPQTTAKRKTHHLQRYPEIGRWHLTGLTGVDTSENAPLWLVRCVQLGVGFWRSEGDEDDCQSSEGLGLDECGVPAGRIGLVF